MVVTEVVVLIILFIIGAILGSFACCQAWRLHLKETGEKNPSKRSVCMSCGKKLSVKENIPIVSWLAQRGKCRHCKAKIGKSEILSEISLGLALVALGACFYPHTISVFTTGNAYDMVALIASMLLLIISITLMWILMVYDAKWQKLPVPILTILITCAIIYTILQLVGVILVATSAQDVISYLINLLLSAIILAGIYFCLSVFSKEKLVGSGDWMLALPIALMLGNWWLALVALFISNLLGSIFGAVLKIKKGTKMIPFGPFLIIAFVAVFAAQDWLLSLIAGLNLF